MPPPIDTDRPEGATDPIADTALPIRTQIEAALGRAFALRELSVEDESERHRGHAGWREGGETHFHVALSTPDFAGLSRLARHRAVHDALGPALIGRIHALRLTLAE